MDQAGEVVKNQKVAQGLRTRQRILEVARDLFGSQGYSATTTTEIVQAAGVTRGALYHHFRDKQDLLRAVFERAEEEISERVAQAAASAGDDLYAATLAAWDAVLDTALDMQLTRVRVIEAPAVLPWEEWHGTQARFALASLEGFVELLNAAGLADPPAPLPLAVLLMGSASEATAVIANADDPQAARAALGEAARWLTARIVGVDEPRPNP